MNTVTARPPATEAELIARNEAGERCELIDGQIRGKPMGAREGFVTGWLITFINTYLIGRKLGFVYTPDVPVRFAPGTVLLPDVAFTARSRCPGGKLPRDQVATVIPNLAVEVLSPSNRPGEMRRKLGIYFAGGVELVWVIDPETRSAAAYTAPDSAVELSLGDSLDGGTVLPGFSIALSTLFEEFD